MKLNLRDIIETPGGRVPFTCALDTERLTHPSVARYAGAPRAVGEVVNTAGVLHVRATVEADMICLCDRCGGEFESTKTLPVHAVAVAEEEPENPEAFTLDGDWLDVGEILETAFILDMETKFLCSEDCRGICPTCGKNLNEGPCSCPKKSDPRLAVLERLLDKEE